MLFYKTKTKKITILLIFITIVMYSLFMFDNNSNIRYCETSLSSQKDPLSILGNKLDKDTVCLIAQLSEETLKDLRKWTPIAVYHFMISSNIQNSKWNSKELVKNINQTLENFTDNCDVYYIDQKLTTLDNLIKLRLFANPNNLVILKNCQSTPDVVTDLVKDGALKIIHTDSNDGRCLVQFTEPTRTLPQLMRLITGKTMVTQTKNVDLYKQIKQFDATGVEGDIVECGVWKGGTSLFMALSTTKDRTLWLYDTFEGHTGEMEKGKDDDRLILKWNKLKKLPSSSRYDVTTYKDENGTIHWSKAGTALVTHTMKLTSKKYHLIKGKVEDTLKERIPDKIAILRLDTDFYSSTKAELDILFPRLVPGGLVIIDDYCTWKGSKTATDEYLENNPNAMCDITKSGSLCFKAIKCIK